MDISGDNSMNLLNRQEKMYIWQKSPPRLSVNSSWAVEIVGTNVNIIYAGNPSSSFLITPDDFVPQVESDTGETFPALHIW